MEEDDDDKRLLSQLQLHCNEEAIRRAQLEVSSLLHSNLPPKPPKVRKLLCLALRRDIWALLSCQPAFGVTGVPQHLLIFRTFDAMLRDCLKDTLRRTSHLVQGLPLASVAGPWEGGHQVEGVPPAAQIGNCRQVFAAWNAQGAFGRSSNEALNTDRMLHFAAHLSLVGATVAVIAEPKLRQHATWPPCTGFKFHGLQTDDPASVAVLVHEAVSHAIVVLEGYGCESAMWVAIQGQISVLMLAVYGPHTGHPVQAREAFWQQRLRECRSIRCLESYRDWPLVILGDTNLHFSFLGPVNARLATPLDREILALFESPECFGVSIRNQGSVATHASGSIIDLVAAEPSLPLDIDTSWLQEEELRSDHAFLLCSSSTATIPILKQQQVGVARWGFGAGWEEASEAVSCSLKFAAAWAACALNDRTLRSWTAQGKCRGTRLNLLDRVVWWRSVLLTLAGHFKGLVWLNRPRQCLACTQKGWQNSLIFQHITSLPHRLTCPTS